MLKLLPFLVLLLPTPGSSRREAVPAQETEGPATIALSATGTASAVPDMANLSFTVEKRANTAAGGDQGDERCGVGRRWRRSATIGVADRDVQTARFSVEPVVIYPDRNRPDQGDRSGQEDAAPKVVGYRVSNGLDVRLRDLSKLGTLLDRMVGLGINSIGRIDFTNADMEPIREEARRDAVARARRKAEVLTSAAGAKLGQPAFDPGGAKRPAAPCHRLRGPRQEREPGSNRSGRDRDVHHGLDGMGDRRVISIRCAGRSARGSRGVLRT